eukprot:jgi/Botrbrau1/9368/Bobra.354_2s0023.1
MLQSFKKTRKNSYFEFKHTYIQVVLNTRSTFKIKRMRTKAGAHKGSPSQILNGKCPAMTDVVIIEGWLHHI